MPLPSVHSLLKKYGIRPKKRLGQNFLIAQPTMQKIVGALGASHDDDVLEIGCGMGVMTAMIAERCHRIVAVDADQRALEIAQEEFGDRKNIAWVKGDILKTDISHHARDRNILVIGNIPYNISSPIFFHLIDHREHIARAILMIQKEVADRIVAKPGSKDYGALTVMLQSYARCTKLFNVARTNFIPPPAVMSSVIELNFDTVINKRDSSASQPLAAPVGMTTRTIPPQALLRIVVRAAFQKRRKMLRNALLGSKDLGLMPDELDRILAECSIDGRRRPETLSVEDFHRITSAIHAKL